MIKVKVLNTKTIENETKMEESYLILENDHFERLDITLDSDGNFRFTFMNHDDCLVSIMPHGDNSFSVKSR